MDHDRAVELLEQLWHEASTQGLADEVQEFVVSNLARSFHNRGNLRKDKLYDHIAAISDFSLGGSSPQRLDCATATETWGRGLDTKQCGCDERSGRQPYKSGHDERQ